jgi:hypothetical protein
MPGALAVLAVFAVVIAAWLNARNPANHNPVEDAERLRRDAGWLAQRREVARREKWGSEMLARLAIELGATAEKLSRAEARVRKH